jgi:hypothetical protein
MNEVLKEIRVYGTWRDDESMGWGEMNKKELHSKYLTLQAIRVKLNQEGLDRQNMYLFPCIFHPLTGGGVHIFLYEYTNWFNFEKLVSVGSQNK